MRARIDAFSDAFGAGEGSGEYSVVNQNTDPNAGPVTSPAPLSRWLPVPGCGVRVYVPYNVSVALWQWSFFFHPARLSMVSQAGVGADAAVNLKEVCEIGLAAMLDGALVEHSRRQTKVFRCVERGWGSRRLSRDGVGFRWSYRRMVGHVSSANERLRLAGMIFSL